MNDKRLLSMVLAVFAVGVTLPLLLSAQSPPSQFESRAELEAHLKTLVGRGENVQAALIRSRLAHGDFLDGDRIVVRVRGNGGFSDTLAVNPEKLLLLPQMGGLSLEGALRSELLPRLTDHVRKYLRDPVVEATPLVRVGILGKVVRPGFYYTSAQLPLSDVLMVAGGPGPDADLQKISVHRGSDVIVDPASVRVALTEGWSMDTLHMQAGDEITVGQEGHFNWAIIVPTVSALLGLMVALGHR